MYQALYRKYRPETFEQVVGQDIITRTLKNSIANNKINHAYLFCGPRGSGKTSVAKLFARIVNCQENKGNMTCNSCVFCTQTNDKNMDIIEIDAASNNGVDEIREINNKVNLAPSLGKYKVYIIDEVHMLTIGAFNALLKTLEEPPKHIIFILATTDPQKVPATISSRCQKFEFKKIKEKEVYENLIKVSGLENFQISNEAILEISKLCDGSMRDALSILDQAVTYCDSAIKLDDIYEINGTISREESITFLDTIINSKLKESLNMLSSYSENGKNLIKVAEGLMELIKNVIIHKFGKNESEKEYEIFDLWDSKKMIKYIEILNDAIINMRKSNNTKMTMELAIIKMTYENKSEIENKIFPGDNIQLESKSLNENIAIENKTTNTDKVKINNEKTNAKQIENKEKECMISQEINGSLNKKFVIFQNTRINNLLANFSKQSTLDNKKKLSTINEYLLKEKYSMIAEIILDGELKASSDEYIVFVFKTLFGTNLFNENIPKIEELIYMISEKNYKVIALENKKWDVIKEKFNNKTTNFNYEEETIQFDDIINKETFSDNIVSTFQEIIEYN